MIVARRYNTASKRKFGGKPSAAQLTKTENAKRRDKVVHPWRFVMACVPFTGLRFLKDGGQKYWHAVARALQDYTRGSLLLETPHVNGVILYDCWGHVPPLPLHVCFFLRRKGTWDEPLNDWDEPKMVAACTTAGQWRVMRYRKNEI